MLRYIFECVKQRLLSGVTELTDVRIFNSQDLSDEHLPFKSPAVFVDFGDIEYETTGYKRQLATTEVIVKLFHEELTLNHLDVFDLQLKIDKQLQNYGEWGGIMERQDRETDDNFDRLYVLDTTYVTTYVDDLHTEDERVPIGDWTNHPLSGTTTGVTDWIFSVSGYSSDNTNFPITDEDELAFTYNIIANLIPEYQAVVNFALANNIELPSSTILKKHNNLLKQLVDNGDWDKMKSFYFNLDSSLEYSLIDWKRLVLAESINSVGYETSKGWIFNGVSNFVNTKFVLNETQVDTNGAHGVFYNNLTPGDLGYVYGVRDVDPDADDFLFIGDVPRVQAGVGSSNKFQADYSTLGLSTEEAKEGVFMVESVVTAITLHHSSGLVNNTQARTQTAVLNDLEVYVGSANISGFFQSSVAFNGKAWFYGLGLDFDTMNNLFLAY